MVATVNLRVGLDPSQRLAKRSGQPGTLPLILNAMHRISFLPFILATVTLVGCGSGEPTVIQPQTYQMSEQEQANRERAATALAEQRQ